MRICWSLALAVSCVSAFVSAADDRGKPKATPVLVHQLIDGACELVQRGQFLQYREYSAIAIDGVPGEVYSIELDKSDFIQLAETDGKAPKSASKAGFVLRPSHAGGNSPDLPRVVPLATNNGCPAVQEAATLAAKQRDSRRASVQAKLYRPGVDDITVPLPLPESSTQPKFDVANAAPLDKPKATHGTVVLALAIGTNGEVKDAKVTRSLDPSLDKKAIEAVRRWRFQPARKQGLPVAALMTVEVNFSLH
jgi:TonB family protein